MSKLENSKKEELKKDLPVKKQKPPAKKQKPPAKSNSPSFLPKEILVFENKDCIFVEKSNGLVVARLLDGGYVSGEESKFTSKQ
jgi:23S rRNA-/tRNA-specific pseudouridylate synthase